MYRLLALLAAGAAALLPAATSSAAATASSISVENLEQIGTGASFMPGPVIGHLGDAVDYQIIVTNNGDDAVTVSLADTGCSGLAVDGAQTLQPGGGYVAYACSHVLGATDGGSWTNLVSVTGTTASGAVVSAAPATAVALVAVSGNVAAAHKTIAHKHRKPRHGRRS
jgi:hypothetical protein